MILAAGLGERLRPITDTTPKALVEVGGISMLSQHLQRLADASVKTVVINLGWLGEQIAEQIGSGQQFGLQVVYSPEYDNILDTGGGIKRALPLIGNVPFWVINADIYTDFALPNVSLLRIVLHILCLCRHQRTRRAGISNCGTAKSEIRTIRT